LRQCFPDNKATRQPGCPQNGEFHALHFDSRSSQCQHRGMTQSKDGYHHGDLRNALVASAAKLIEQGGPGAFSLREAAREVGVSANAAYRHFEDKAALMSSVAAYGFGLLATKMLKAMDGAITHRVKDSASVARLKAVGRSCVEFALEQPEIFRLMFGEFGVNCRREAENVSDMETPWTILGKTLDALVADKLLAPERRPGAELKMWSVVHGFASLSVDGLVTKGTARETKAALETLLDFAVVGLCSS